MTEQLEKERYRKEIDLSNALDYLCRATGRDIFIMLPEKVEERNPYLIKEIKETVKEFDNDN
jgi:DNA-binding XRE family transcriptional regulator